MGDDAEISLLIEIEVVSVVDLQQLAGADFVCRAADDSGGELGIEAGAEVEAVADEVIAQEDGGFVAAKMVDGRAFSAELGFVEDVIVDEGGHVDHFDDGGQDDVGVGELAAGFAGEKKQKGAEHFSAEPADVLDELS